MITFEAFASLSLSSALQQRRTSYLILIGVDLVVFKKISGPRKGLRAFGFATIVWLAILGKAFMRVIAKIARRMGSILNLPYLSHEAASFPLYYLKVTSVYC